MKNKFIFVASLIVSVMLAMTAFAADTWKQTEDQWYCYDGDGNAYYGVIKKSGENYYYLDDSTGAMVTNKLVELDGAKYWFGADGAKVIDAWVQVPVDTGISEDGWEWMYFKSVSGKAAIGEGSLATIHGKKYVFDNEGYMQYGYQKDLSGNEAENAVEANYYFGEKSDGSAQTGWVKFTDGSAGPGYDDKELVYFYFKNGKKIKAESDVVASTIDGVKYYFNEDGSLYTGYQVYATGSFTTIGTYYLGESNDGTMKKKQWVKTTEIEGTDDAYWYYIGYDGTVTVGGDNDTIKKINGKLYWISAKGRMKTGLAVAEIENYQGYKNVSEENPVILSKTFGSVEEYKAYELGEKEKIYYFSTDADNDGSMKTGTIDVSIDGETVKIYFDSKGAAYEGIVKDYVYNNGVRPTLVGVVRCHKDGVYYLVNASGKILKKTSIKDSDGQLWSVDANNSIAKIADQDYSGKAATAWKNGEKTFIVNNVTYTLDVQAGTGYSYVRYTR